MTQWTSTRTFRLARRSCSSRRCLDSSSSPGAGIFKSFGYTDALCTSGDCEPSRQLLSISKPQAKEIARVALLDLPLPWLPPAPREKAAAE